MCDAHFSFGNRVYILSSTRSWSAQKSAGRVSEQLTQQPLLDRFGQ